MESTVDFTRETKELQTVLASGVFDRSPMLAQLLKYVCSKYFEGSAEAIKEFSIAVDVLGRSAEFDPKKDSIIRVQFHRLREKLNEYYANGGASHPVHIVIPHGHYAPQFVYREDAAESEPLAEPEPNFSAPLSPERLAVEQLGDIVPPRLAGRRTYLSKLALGIAALAVLGTVAFSLASGNGSGKKPGAVIATPLGDSIRVLAGLADGNYTDGYGHVWVSDRFFHGGSIATSGNHPIWGTRDPRLYQSWRQGSFSYDIPVKPGDYEVRLYFAETYFGDGNAAGFGGENTRFFDVAINGVPVKKHFSVAGEAGVNVALVKVFQDVSPARDGYIHIGFAKASYEPFVNAIEVTPGLTGKLSPIRLIAQPPGYTDSNGQVWVSDRLAVGGQVVTRSADVTGAEDPQLYAGERFGNFSYTIPVTPAKYTLVLHMAERWLGPGQPGGKAGTGSRLFDLLCNGVFLERNFDVYSRAGGPNRALTRIYRGIEPNHQGNIVLSFVPIKNFAIMSALEVIQE
jgi:hypothetical protein